MTQTAIDPTREELAAKRAQLIADLKLTLDSKFVPWSQSRNRNEKDDRGNPRRSLNWIVALKRDGRAILETDYAQGIGHAPSHPKGLKRLMADDYRALEIESETGCRAASSPGTSPYKTTKPLNPPTLENVLWSLLLDASALDEATFEDWASSLGYDTDSRKAESIWRQCINIALKLRATLGDENLAKLRDAFQDY